MKKSSPKMIQKPSPCTPIAAEMATVSATRIADIENSTMLNRPNTLGLSASAASGAVVDKGTTGSSQPVVEADAGCEAEEAREEALTQPGDGARPVALEGEEVLAGPEDRLDALADGGEVRTVALSLIHISEPTRPY